MSEKRFVCIDIGYGDEWYITDNGKRLSEREIVDLLNKQQSIIRRDEISINIMMSNMEKLEKENKQLKQEHKIAIDEMITDYKKLEKKNKQLQAELDSFRPVLFHDMRIGTITLYSKGGINE